MRVAVLGPLEVRDDAGELIALGGARLRTLLTRLALDAGRVVAARQLVDAVWGDEPPDAVTNALQALVSRLRRSQVPVHSDPAGYRLDLDPQSTDVGQFESLVALGRSQAPVDPAGAAASLREALALWRGPLVEVDLPAVAARLTELRLAALEQLAALSPAGAIADLTAAAEEHPTREPLAAALMRTLWTDGRPAEALAVYERTRSALAAELGTDPSPYVAELHVAILRGSTPSSVAGSAGPAAVAPVAPRSNLRSSITSFVGRDEDVATVRDLVGRSRLTTLVGPGGAGKTRLAIESARGLPAPDGLWLVELAPVSDPAEVPAAVLATLGLREQALLSGSRSRAASLEISDPTARTVAALAEKRALLVLDNCEHLIGAAAALADRLLAECPRLRILATSREPLTITGETLWTVEPLATPSVGADAETALRYPSVRLLLDRGAAVQPGFTVDESNVESVVELCRSLDGMPLAIELAAARLRTMTPAQIGQRLDDRFRLLVGGSRTALPRHQTLRAVVDWSWELLDDQERMLLRRLAVFTGGATVAAAQAVCGTGEATFGLLTTLVDKSLLVTRPGPDDARFGMLETIKAYGLDRLAEAGEADQIRWAHVDSCVALAEAAEPELRASGQLVWLDRLAADHENLHAAIRYAIAQGNADRAVRLAGGLGWYWFLHGHRGEGADLAQQALTLPGETPPVPRALALAMGALNGFTAQHNGEVTLRMMEDAVRLAAEAPGTDSHPILRLLRPLTGFFAHHRALIDRTTKVMSSFSACFDDPDPWVRSAAHAFHAHAAFNVGSDDEAELEFLEGLQGFRDIGDRWGMSFTLATLAEAAAGHGEHATAAAYLAEALDIATELGMSEDLCQIQSQYAHELLLVGSLEQANAMLARAEATADDIGLAECDIQIAYEQGEFARAAGDLDRARSCYGRALAGIETWRIAPQFAAVLRSSLATVLARAGDTVGTRQHSELALSLALASQDLPAVRRVLANLADVALLSGEPVRAAILLGASADNRGRACQGVMGAVEVERDVRGLLGPAAYADAFDRGRRAELAELPTLADLVLTTPA